MLILVALEYGLKILFDVIYNNHKYRVIVELRNYKYLNSVSWEII